MTYRADLAHREVRNATIVITVVTLLFAGVLAATLAAVTAAERYFFDDMPRLPASSEMWAIGREPSIRLLDRNGVEIANRGPLYGRAVDHRELPPHLVQAFISTEDRRFWEHDGVDVRSLLRAMLANWRAGRVTQGGSTITQQLVKNLVLTPERTIKRKVQEMRLARELEMILTKDQILNLYLNRIFLGGRSYGVDGASWRYFGHSAREVSLQEAAILAALPKAPSRYDPSRNMGDAQTRASVVLANMEAQGYLTAEARAEAEANPASLLADDEDAAAAAAAAQYGYAFDHILEEAANLLPREHPDLVVTTTLDTRLQAAAETAVAQVLDRSGQRRRASQAAVVALDETGGIVAMVGGRSYAESKFNRATQAQRQPGSSFKAVVYAAALEAGARPEQIYVDEPINMRVGPDMWSPGNYYPGYRGAMSLRTAFENSVNTIAVKLVQQIGASRVARLGQRLGIGRELQAVPSIALGTQWATPVEMATVFSVFANEGALFRPYMVTKIENTKGDVLYLRPSFEPSRVYDPRLARTMNTLLRDAVVYGTGRSAAPRGVEVAGKTGTTQDWRDAWFVGFSSLFTTAVWVGNDDFSPMNEVTGGSLPAEIWRDFMTYAHNGETPPEQLSLAVAPEIGPRQRDLGTYYSNLALAFGRIERLN